MEFWQSFVLLSHSRCIDLNIFLQMEKNKICKYLVLFCDKGKLTIGKANATTIYSAASKDVSSSIGH
jgi:hypothetical protein